MPDNIAITSGVGTTIRTDDLGAAGHVQYMKLMDGTDGSAVVVPADAIYGLDVDVSRMQPDTVVTANITATDAVVAVPVSDGTFRSGVSTAGSHVAAATIGVNSSWTVAFTGTWTGTIYFEGSLDSTNGTDGNWIGLDGRRVNADGAVFGPTATANGVYRVAAGGFKYVRVRAVGAWTGTATVNIRIAAGTSVVFINGSLPAGRNLMGVIEQRPSLVATAISAANAAVTLTIAAPGAGNFHYITGIEIIALNPTATAIAAGASNLAYTTTNLPTGLAWNTGNALAAGSEKLVERAFFNSPVKSTAANTATTIVAPAIGAGGLVRITAFYYIAP